MSGPLHILSPDNLCAHTRARARGLVDHIDASAGSDGNTTPWRSVTFDSPRPGTADRGLRIPARGSGGHDAGSAGSDEDSSRRFARRAGSGQLDKYQPE